MADNATIVYVTTSPSAEQMMTQFPDSPTFADIGKLVLRLVQNTNYPTPIEVDLIKHQDRLELPESGYPPVVALMRRTPDGWKCRFVDRHEASQRRQGGHGNTIVF